MIILQNTRPSVLQNARPPCCKTIDSAKLATVLQKNRRRFKCVVLAAKGAFRAHQTNIPPPAACALHPLSRSQSSYIVHCGHHSLQTYQPRLSLHLETCLRISSVPPA